MPILTVLFTLIVIGVLLWLCNTYIPMDPTIKRIINGVVVICVVLWLISLFFNLGSLNSIRIGK